ncbi:WSC-domain-containing protein [Rickenella mellea]|uniref:WSC-domain-containing protein n=1 Tax=Rickenella mellea TaxID=50990 RepID=A0A4Y7Q751_9AGAM|nr:WSC-domain-containing protein [Rickenella mellea]
MFVKMFSLTLAAFTPLLLPLQRTGVDATASHRRQSLAVPATLPGQWTSRGCYTDSTSNRALNGLSQSNGVMTIENCINFCTSNSFVYAGVEFSQECYCGNQLIGSTQAASTDCNMACAGSATEPCGGPARLNLFLNGNTPPANPSTPSQVGDWNSVGCWTDAPAARTMPFSPSVAQPMTIQKCTNACFAAGYSLSGVEFADECYCGNEFNQTAKLDSTASGCNMPCNGNITQLCGGANRLNVYEYKSTAPPKIKSDPLYLWFPQGCILNPPPSRHLGNLVPVNGSFTIENCLEACSNANFLIAGIQSGNQCFCGSSFMSTPVYTDGCIIPCFGSRTETCGGAFRLQVYQNLLAAPAPTQQPTIDTWKSEGCFTDNVSARTLTQPMSVQGAMTEEACTTACFGFKFAGVGSSNQCYCDNFIQNGGVSTTAGCDMSCSGNSFELCGGASSLNVFKHMKAPTTSREVPQDP